MTHRARSVSTAHDSTARQPAGVPHWVEEASLDTDAEKELHARGRSHLALAPGEFLLHTRCGGVAVAARTQRLDSNPISAKARIRPLLQ